jgi:hypothetical protein
LLRHAHFVENKQKGKLNGYIGCFKSHFCINILSKFVCCSLGELETELKKENIKDIRFLIINAFDSESIDNIAVLKNLTSINVVQDTSKINIWGLYNGTTDDMLIFNRYLRENWSVPESL